MSDNNNDNKNEEKENQSKAKEDNNNVKQKENSNNTNLKDLPSYEYFQKTVQKEIQLGLMNLSKLKPADPIKYLGEFLLEKSKSYKA